MDSWKKFSHALSCCSNVLSVLSSFDASKTTDLSWCNAWCNRLESSTSALSRSKDSIGSPTFEFESALRKLDCSLHDMKCSKCSSFSLLDAHAKFCIHCGAPASFQSTKRVTIPELSRCVKALQTRIEATKMSPAPRAPSVAAHSHRSSIIKGNKCETCNAMVDVDARFCTSCGSIIPTRHGGVSSNPPSSKVDRSTSRANGKSSKFDGNSSRGGSAISRSSDRTSKSSGSIFKSSTSTISKSISTIGKSSPDIMKSFSTKGKSPLGGGGGGGGGGKSSSDGIVKSSPANIAKTDEASSAEAMYSSMRNSLRKTSTPTPSSPPPSHEKDPGDMVSPAGTTVRSRKSKPNPTRSPRGESTHSPDGAKTTSPRNKTTSPRNKTTSPRNKTTSPRSPRSGGSILSSSDSSVGKKPRRRRKFSTKTLQKKISLAVKDLDSATTTTTTKGSKAPEASTTTSNVNGDGSSLTTTSKPAEPLHKKIQGQSQDKRLSTLERKYAGHTRSSISADGGKKQWTNDKGSAGIVDSTRDSESKQSSPSAAMYADVRANLKRTPTVTPTTAVASSAQKASSPSPPSTSPHVVGTTFSSSGTNVVCETSSSLPESSSALISQWTKEQVALWMKEVGLSKWIDTFDLHGITGLVLVELDNDDLKDMNVSNVGDRKTILLKIRGLKSLGFPTTISDNRGGLAQSSGGWRERAAINAHKKEEILSRGGYDGGYYDGGYYDGGYYDGGGYDGGYYDGGGYDAMGDAQDGYGNLSGGGRSLAMTLARQAMSRTSSGDESSLATLHVTDDAPAKVPPQGGLRSSRQHRARESIMASSAMMINLQKRLNSFSESPTPDDGNRRFATRHRADTFARGEIGDHTPLPHSRVPLEYTSGEDGKSTSGEDGVHVVTAGTTGALVHQLMATVMPKGFDMEEYTVGFFRAVEMFLSPYDLLGELIYLYNKSKSDTKRLRVMELLHIWVDTSPHHWRDDRLYNRAKTFIKTLSMSQGKKSRDNADVEGFSSFGIKLDSVARSSPNHFYHARVELTDTPPPTHDGDPPWISHGWDGIVHEICLSYHNLLTRINPQDELKGEVWNKEPHRAPNVVKLIQRFNDLSFWLQTVFVCTPDVRQRAALLGSFIKMGKSFLRLNNFHGVMAVLAALNSAGLQRMKRSWSLLKRSSWKTFDNLSALFDPAGNLNRYRQRLLNSRPPGIPYLGLILNDLTIFGEVSDTIEDVALQTSPSIDDPPIKMVNYAKMYSTGALLDSLYRFQRKPYEKITSDRKLQWYFESPKVLSNEESQHAGMEGYAFDAMVIMSEDGIYKRSLVLEPRGSFTGEMRKRGWTKRK